MRASGERRVVITGLGIVSALGSDVGEVMSRLLEGRSGIGKVESFAPPKEIAGEIPCRVGGEVFLRDFSTPEAAPAPAPTAEPTAAPEPAPEPEPEPAPDPAPIDRFYSDCQGLSLKERRRMDKFLQYAILASHSAIADSGYEVASDNARYRTGVLLGSGMGGVSTVAAAQRTLHSVGARRVSPFSVPYSMINSLSGEVAIRQGYLGVNYAVVSACATGAHAIGEGARAIICDDADTMIVGGSEATITDLSYSAFCAARAMSTGFNDDPEAASRPWDKLRDGFVMGEGAGVLVLEEYECARKRGARIYAELRGYGATCDGYHITAPDPAGEGSYRAMQLAFSRSGLAASAIGYGNAHSTSTPLGDDIELRTIERLYGADASGLCISSTKSALGHALGASGAIEAIISICALQRGELPPTLNLSAPSSASPIDRLALAGKSKELRAVFSNSFGFGGANVCLVFSKC